MTTTPTADGESVHVALVGEFDLAAVPRWRSAVTELFRTSWTSVTFDLREVTFIDSAGLGSLIGIHRRAQGFHGKITLMVSTPVEDLIQRCQLDHLFEFAHGDPTDAEGTHAWATGDR